MIENFNDVAAAFEGFLQDIIGWRTTGSYVSGRWTLNSPTVLNFKGVIQVATPADLKVLAEGQRIEEAIKIHTTFNLVAQSDDATGDKITYKGKEWIVYNVANQFIGGYYKSIAIQQ